MPSVLVIEDDLTTRRLIYYSLSLDGNFSVKSVANGSEAVSYLETAKGLDLVVCDLLLPDIDGFEIFKRYGDKFSFVIITSLDSINLIDDLKRMGVEEVIHKPFNFFRFLETCRRVLGLDLETPEKLEERAKKIKAELEIYQKIKRDKNE